MKISFSTLGCPDWSFSQIVRVGQENGYDGIAFRGMLREHDLTKVPEFSKSERASTFRRLREAGLQANLMLASARMLIVDADDLAKSQRNAEEHIDLASDMECPSVRVFGGVVPSGVSRTAAVRRCAERVSRLGDYAARRGVQVLIETHDDWISPAFLRRAVEAAAHPAVGVLWDVHHTYRTNETPLADAWDTLGPWIRSVDLKDSVVDFSEHQGYRYVGTGKGSIPIKQTLALLYGAGYDGWITFEWEKHWHPEIEDPEEVIPKFRRIIAKHLAEVEQEPR